MSEVVIRADGLGKKYLIGHQAAAERYVALRDVVARTAKGLTRSAHEMWRGRQLVGGDEVEEFWALKDVNFEIKRGDVVGVIGRNGAGKSTLLKILSRITEPSAGRVEIKGRVASLLEVGTGFHPELTGRENIYLNGAILGMSRAEIRRKFDEIVAFAEVEKFLDTPVKRYSSGMYVRLAFAVAAHLEPEILVVDEVLAVGDAEFQKKCLGKMEEVAGHGRTVLFVSHNVAAINSLCNVAILLRGGMKQFLGTTHAALDLYAESQRSSPDSRSLGIGDTNRLINSVWLDIANSTQSTLRVNTSLTLDQDEFYEFRAFVTGSRSEAIGLISLGGFGSVGLSLRKGSFDASIGVDVSFLAEGIYYLDLQLVRVKDGKRFESPERIEFAHNPNPASREAAVFQAKWGLGFIRFPATVKFG
jgi:ABC-type polysaccharide/polyol phosphate transport system ATPase subunit